MTIYLLECDYVSSAQNSYDSANSLVSVLTRPRPPRFWFASSAYRANMAQLRSRIQEIEDNIWQALARDYPKFRYRRQNQTVVISYLTGGSPVYINYGEIWKIKSWGHNEYYEALDTINRMQSRLWNNNVILDRNWQDEFRRLGVQLNIINNRNCSRFAEPLPWAPPSLPICPPAPPAPPGPVYPVWPCPPLPQQNLWLPHETRNWSITGWGLPADCPPGFFCPAVIRSIPHIAKIENRELVYMLPEGGFRGKIVWLFHGNNSNARDWFTDYEKIQYVKDFLDNGYVVAAYESFNRVNKKWSATANVSTNRDVVGMRKAKDFLLSLVPFNLASAQVHYGAGMNSGATFVSYASGALGLTGVSMHNAIGLNSIIRSSSYAANTMWNVASNDITIDNSDASDNFNFLTVNRPSLGKKYLTQNAIPISVEIIDAIPGVSTLIATTIVQGLYSNQFINADGTITSKYSDASRTTRESYLYTTIPSIIASAFGNDVVNASRYNNDIIALIKIAFGDHEFAGFYRQQTAGGTSFSGGTPAFTQYLVNVDRLFFDNPNFVLPTPV